MTRLQISRPFPVTVDQRQDSGASASTASSHKTLPPVPARKYTFASAASSESDRKRRRKRWISFSLRPPFLIALAALSLLFVGGIELVRQLSIQNFGLAFFEDSDSIPTWIYFLYNFLPTILAVPYAWLWNMTSTDAKRLESYFHLTEPGVPASLLFIDYTFQSPMTAPITAFRRRHWPVVWLGPVSLLISLVFTASQGGLFGLSEVTFPTNVSFSSYPNLIGSDEQIQSISPNWTSKESFVTSGQAVPLPAFVTSNYSVTPFNISSHLAKNETWSTETQLYWAEPGCQQMTIGSIQVVEPSNDTLQEENQDPLDGFGIRNKLFELKLENMTVAGTDCQISLAIQWIAEFSPSGVQNFLPLLDNITQPRSGSIDDFPVAQDRIFRGNAWGAMFGTCPDFDWWAGLVRYTWLDSEPAPEPNSLSTFASASAPSFIQFSVAATACRATYLTAKGAVTVNGADQTVVTAGTSLDGEELTADQFNSSAFENSLQLISSVEDPSFENVTFEVPLGNFDVLYGAYDQFSTIVLKNSTNASDLLVGNEWSSRIDTAWRLGFSIGFQDVFDTNAEPVPLEGVRVTSAVAITVTSVFAILSEVLAAIAAITAVVTLFVYRRRDNILQSDPDSLAAMCSLATDLLSEKTLADFCTDGFDRASTRELKQELANARLLNTPDDRLLTYYSHDRQTEPKQVTRSLSVGQHTSDRMSFFLTLHGWLFSFGCLAVILGGTITAFAVSTNNNGFSFLANLNDFSPQLLYSFAPTLVATIIDTSFQQLHRDMGVLESFVRLSNRYQTAADSLTLRYSSRPSIVTAWPALRRKHWFMAFLSVICISTSALNVVSAALFSQAFVTVDYPASFVSTVSATALPFDWDPLALDMMRPFGAVEAVLVGGQQQLPWTDEKYAYIPVGMEGATSDDAAQFTAPTIAIGVEFACQPIPMQPNTTDSDRGVITQEGTPGVSFTNRTAFWTIQDPDLNKDIRCSVEWQDVAGEPGNSSITVAPLTIGGDTNSSVTAATDGTICGRFTTFLLATQSNDNITQTDYAWTCAPTLALHDASVTFTSSGQIVASTISPNTSAQTQSFFTNTTQFVGTFASYYAVFTGRSFSESPLGTFDLAGLLSVAAANGSYDAASLDIPAGQVFSRVFASFFTIYRSNLLAAPGLQSRSSSSAPGTLSTRAARVLPSTPLFAATIALLVVYMGTAVAVLRARRGKFQGPRVPSSLGAVLPWIAGSRVRAEMCGLHALSSAERELVLQRRNIKYGFGWFVDEAGQWRLGLEEEPRVTRGATEGPGRPVPVVARVLVESPVLGMDKDDDDFGTQRSVSSGVVSPL